MCRLKTEWTGAEAFLFSDEILEELKEFEKDGLLTISGKSIVVEEAGRPFVRNICMALDLRLRRNKPETRLFSLTV
jgi:oxygen-independent coproporphyrinogen III oxidase